jgi:hypothetical protein
VHKKALQYETVKHFSGYHSRLIWLEKITGFTVAIGCVLMLGGCGKHEPANQIAAAQPVADTNQIPAPLPPPVNQVPGTPPVIAVSPNGGADLRQLNHAYISWIVQNRRRPKDFEDYVTTSGIQVPPAPDGKKYIIDKNGFIAEVAQ